MQKAKIMDYNKQAENFLKETATNLEITKAKHQTAPIWADDGYHGINYLVTLKRNSETWNFNFWGSINDKERGKEPTAYDILAGITKYDPESRADFYSAFGYDATDPKTEMTYKAVVKEWENVNRLFEDVLESLRDVQ